MNGEKKIDWERVALVVFIVLVCIAVTGALVWAIRAAAKSNRVARERDKLCVDAGYIDSSWIVDDQYICYGYVEGNRLITKPFDDVKASMGE